MLTGYSLLLTGRVTFPAEMGHSLRHYSSLMGYICLTCFSKLSNNIFQSQKPILGIVVVPIRAHIWSHLSLHIPSQVISLGLPLQRRQDVIDNKDVYHFQKKPPEPAQSFKSAIGYPLNDHVISCMLNLMHLLICVCVIREIYAGRWAFFEFARSMTFFFIWDAARLDDVHTKTWLGRDCALGFEDNVKHDRKEGKKIETRNKIKESNVQMEIIIVFFLNLTVCCLLCHPSNEPLFLHHFNSTTGLWNKGTWEFIFGRKLLESC